MGAVVLVDTSALLALVHQRDQSHARARYLARGHLSGGGQFVGTTLVLAELHAHMLQRRGPAEARAVVSGLLDDGAYRWTDVTVDLVGGALDRWLTKFADQRFSLTDAVSFEVMRRERLTTAFAFDVHFERAGFRLLR